MAGACKSSSIARLSIALTIDPKVQSSQSDSYWLAIKKYMDHDKLNLAPPPISHLLVGVTEDNVPYSLALQHDLVRVSEARRAIMAKTIQPLPIIPVTMTDEELFPHFCQDLVALQPPDVVVSNDTARDLWDSLRDQRKERLRKMSVKVD